MDVQKKHFTTSISIHSGIVNMLLLGAKDDIDIHFIKGK